MEIVRIYKYILHYKTAWDDVPLEDILIRFHEEIHPRKIKDKLDILSELGLIIPIEKEDNLKYRCPYRRLTNNLNQEEKEHGI